jgi:enoyl-CoA hydratase/carnithine racemase
VTTLAVDPDAGFRAEVHLDADDPLRGLATITLDRPERLNAQSPTMWAELTRVRRHLPGEIRVVVLGGAGRAFSAGLDRALFTDAEHGIQSLPRLPMAQATERIAAWQEAFDWRSRPDLVSIAAVHGHAIGGGFQLALGTDIRLIADDTQFTMAETGLGIVPDLGGTKRLVDLVGYSRAAEICLTGRRVGAVEAAAIGLASRVVPAAELDAAVRDTVTALLGTDRDAATETKALLARAADHSQTDQQAAEREAQYRRLRAIAGLDGED